MEKDPFLVDMGRRIARQRKLLKKTQEQVAEEMGISLQSVSCIELGKKAIRPGNLVKLCAALHTTADYILTGRRPEQQMHRLQKDLAALPEKDYKMVEELVHRLRNKA